MKKLVDIVVNFPWKTFIPKAYVEVVCKDLEARFEDNDVIDAFKVFSVIHMPHMEIVIAS